MTELPAIPGDWRKQLTKGGLGCRIVEPFGPCGLRCAPVTRGSERGVIIVTESDFPSDPGMPWLHASMSWERRLPTYGELALLHRAFFGRRRYAYQVFAPDGDHVNIHPNALHLWGRVDGKPALGPLAEFVTDVGSI